MEKRIKVLMDNEVKRATKEYLQELKRFNRDMLHFLETTYNKRGFNGRGQASLG